LVRNKDKKTIIRKTKKMKNKTRPMAFNRRPRERFLCNNKKYMKIYILTRGFNLTAERRTTPAN